MAKTTKAEDAFQDLLEGQPGKASPQLEQLTKLAAALEPARRPGLDPRFKARLRSELLAKASATEEDVFAELLEGNFEDAPEEIRPLVAIAAALEPARLPVPDVAFRYRLRNQLLAQASRKETFLARVGERAAVINSRMRRSLRVVGATGMAALMMLSGGAALAAASNALPGDALYGVKQWKESAELAVISGEEEGIRLLSFAGNRLDEVQGLDERGDTRQALYIGALDDMDSLTNRGARIIIAAFRERNGREPAAMRQLEQFTMDQRLELTRLIDRLPPAVRPAALDSITLAEDVQERTQIVLANPACPCPSDPLVPAPGTPTGSSSNSGEQFGCACDSTGGFDSGNGSTDGSGSNDPDEGTNDPGPDPGPGPGPGPEDPDEDYVPDVDGTDVDDTIDDTIEDLIDDLGGLPTPTPSPLPSPLPSVDVPGLP